MVVHCWKPSLWPLLGVIALLLLLTAAGDETTLYSFSRRRGLSRPNVSGSFRHNCDNPPHQNIFVTNCDNDNGSTKGKTMDKDDGGTHNSTDQSTTSTPVLTFTIRIGFVETSGREPNTTEVIAMLCQVNRFVEQRLRNKTKDDQIQSRLHNIDSEYDEVGKTWEVHFLTDATFGYGAPMSPWTLIKLMELPKDDIRLLVRYYVWPLTDTIFAQATTLFFGGTLTTADPLRKATSWDELPGNCPPPPATLPPQGNIFGHQTPVPRPDHSYDTTNVSDNSYENRDGGRKPAFLAPFMDLPPNGIVEDTRSSNAADHGSIGNSPSQASTVSTPSLATIGARNRVTIPVSFWVANDQGITDAFWIQSQWLTPSFSMLVDFLVASITNTTPAMLAAGVNGNTSSTIPEVVPNSATVVKVSPMACPIPDAVYRDYWLCHMVVAQYELMVESVAIPMLVDPALYTHAIRDAIETGLYESHMFRRRAKGSNPTMSIRLRVGNDVQALQPLYWQTNTTSREYLWPNSTTSAINSPVTSSTAAWVGILLGSLFLLLMVVLVSLQCFCLCKAHGLRQQQQIALEEMEALLLPPPNDSVNDPAIPSRILVCAAHNPDCDEEVI